MKFLEDMFENMDITPLNIYYNKGDYNSYDDDFIDIVFKDMATNRKYVKTICNPEIEIWITKPEFRNYKYIKNFMDKSQCYPVRVKYKTRFSELAKILHDDPKNVKYSPYIFQADMKIEHFYMMQFIMEYGNDKIKKISMGYMDIENDIFQVNGFPEPGEAPINCVTFIDEERHQSYTLILKKDNIPYTNEDNPKHEAYENLRESFNKQVDDFEAHTLEFINELKYGTDNEAGYDEIYGVFHYNILIFSDESKLITTLFKIMRASDNDFIYIWNSPYDMQNLIERTKYLGMDPLEVIGDPSFKGGGDRLVYFKEDTNALAHKRKHVCNTYTMPTFVDQMVVYAGIRSARGKIPSLKLNAIARKELKDEKLDYSEEGNMKYFPYLNFKKFVAYNIKDVMLQHGINSKTKDSTTMYMNMYSNAVLVNEIFTSTTLLANALRIFVFNLRNGYLLGSNKNKLFKNNGVDYSVLFNNTNNDSTDDDTNEADSFYVGVDEVEGEESEEDEKYQGAYVMNPEHMSPTGFKLFGKENKYIHEHGIDMDITSEYPTGIIIMNSSNDTLVGKVYIDDVDSIKVPIYNNFHFIGKEEKEYKLDISNFMLEVLSQNDILNFGRIFLDLPSFSTVLEDSKDRLSELTKK